MHWHVGACGLLLSMQPTLCLCLPAQRPGRVMWNALVTDARTSYYSVLTAYSFSNDRSFLETVSEIMPSGAAQVYRTHSPMTLAPLSDNTCLCSQISTQLCAHLRNGRHSFVSQFFPWACEAPMVDVARCAAVPPPLCHGSSQRPVQLCWPEASQCIGNGVQVAAMPSAWRKRLSMAVDNAPQASRPWP